MEKLKTEKGTRQKVLEGILTKEEKRKFFTRDLTIDGEMSVRIPGGGSYENVDMFSVCYETPIEIDLSGRIAETETETGKGLIVENGRVQLTAYRENIESKLAPDEKEITLLRATDPEITLYQNDEKTVLNQVMGIPVICVKRGFVTYSPIK